VIDLHLDEHVAIIGTSGSGKSTTAKVRAEASLDDKRHTLITDHTGIWWGLRSSADGKGAGFDIPIFGGRHADIAISPGDGAAVARIVAEGASAIVDLSAMRSGREQRTFMAAFASGIRAKPPGHFQWIVDEADEDVPEKVRDELGFALAEDMIWMAKRGRSDGFVMTFVTQRTADIANAALSQCTTIYAHNLISPADTEAFRKYVRAHGTKAELAELMAGLPALQLGERYVYSPKNHLLERGRTPLPVTFDSGATPAAGEARREPKMLAELDVSRIRAALAQPPVATASEAEALLAIVGPQAARAEGDAITLGLQAVRLKTDLDLAHARIAELEATNARLQHDRETLDQVSARCLAIGASIQESMNELLDLFDDERAHPIIEIPAPAGSASPDANPGSIVTGDAQFTQKAAVRIDVDAAKAGAGVLDLQPALQRILDQLAWACSALHKPAISKQILAIVLGVHPRTKGFLNNLGTLRSAGLVDYVDGAVVLTATGADQAARPAIAGAPLKQLRDQICKWLPAAQARILRLAFDAFPNTIERDRLAELLNTHPRTKGFLNNIGRLRTLGLLAGTPSHLRAAGYLFRKD
jgi:energy-coupling factor transporter ATP-binding protein EcfA2